MKSAGRYSWIAIACGALLGILGMYLYQRSTERSRFIEDPTLHRCRGNLRLIDGAKTTWALATNKRGPETPTWSDLRPYMKLTNGNELTCPAGGSYTIGSLNEIPRCSRPEHWI